MDRSSRHKINKKTQALNDTIDQIDLIDIYEIPFKNSRLHFLLKCTRHILQDRSHLGSQIKLGKFKKIEIISSIFSDHSTMRLEINYMEKNVKAQTDGG